MDYVGNCVDSFDSDGDCINDFLPWADATEFAQAEERKEPAHPFQVAQRIRQLEFYVMDGVMVAYDPNRDVHYFYI
jgi:hypothetical protein